MNITPKETAFLVPALELYLVWLADELQNPTEHNTIIYKQEEQETLKGLHEKLTAKRNYEVIANDFALASLGKIDMWNNFQNANTTNYESMYLEAHTYFENKCVELLEELGKCTK